MEGWKERLYVFVGEGRGFFSFFSFCGGWARFLVESESDDCASFIKAVTVAWQD